MTSFFVSFSECVTYSELDLKEIQNEEQSDYCKLWYISWNNI